MDRIKRWLPLILVLTLSAFFAGAFVFTHDRVDKEIEVGPSGLARVNPYLAAEWTLEELGVPTESTFGLVELPPRDHLVVLLDTNSAMRAPIADELLDWVDYGGTLVHLRPDEPDTLSRAIGWDLVSSAWGDGQAYGAGTIIMMESGGWLTNEYLGDHDNAERLWSMGRAHVGAVFIIRGETPGVFTLLWRNAWMLCVSVVLLALAWLWAVSGRFGPLLPDPVPVRRSLLEHIEGAGAFLWRHHQQKNLMESARRALLARLEVHLPGVLEMDAEQQHLLIAEQTGVSATDVRNALAGPARSRRQFTRRMRELQMMWRAT